MPSLQYTRTPYSEERALKHFFFFLPRILTDSQLLQSIPQTSEGLQSLLEKYRSTLEKRDRVTKSVLSERRQHDVIKWELEHQKRRGRDYSGLIDTIQKANVGLQSQVALMSRSKHSGRTMSSKYMFLRFTM